MRNNFISLAIIAIIGFSSCRINDPLQSYLESSPELDHDSTGKKYLYSITRVVEDRRFNYKLIFLSTNDVNTPNIIQVSKGSKHYFIPMSASTNKYYWNLGGKERTFNNHQNTKPTFEGEIARAHERLNLKENIAFPFFFNDLFRGLLKYSEIVQNKKSDSLVVEYREGLYSKYNFIISHFSRQGFFLETYEVIGCDSGSL